MPDLTLPPVPTVLDAGTFARAWLSVALASAKDTVPTLDRTVAVEVYREGVRLVATDRFMLLHSWVPDADHDLAEEPDLAVLPESTAVAFDEHGRARGFLAYVRRLESDDEREKPGRVELTLGSTEPDETVQGAFDGMDRTYTTLDYPGRERLRLLEVAAEFPDWRKMIGAFTGRKTDAVALNPHIVGRLAKLGNYHAGPLVWLFGGRDKQARLTIGEAPRVDGAVMPVRVDPETFLR